jgi:hypothetical protein
LVAFVHTVTRKLSVSFVRFRAPLHYWNWVRVAVVLTTQQAFLFIALVVILLYLLNS